MFYNNITEIKFQSIWLKLQHRLFLNGFYSDILTASKIKT